MLDTVWRMVFLGVCSITDIKEQKINVLFCILNMLLMTFLHIICDDFSVWNIIGGIILAGVLFIINRLSRGGIGMGDVFMIGTIACVCGAIKTMEILFWCCMTCVIFSIVGILVKRINLKSKIPFAPFMLAGNIVVLLIV